MSTGVPQPARKQQMPDTPATKDLSQRTAERTGPLDPTTYQEIVDRLRFVLDAGTRSGLQNEVGHHVGELMRIFYKHAILNKVDAKP